MAGAAAGAGTGVSAAGAERTPKPALRAKLEVVTAAMLARGLGGESRWCAACIRLRDVPGHQLLSTYRVQLRAELDFDAAAAVADYLSALGVSHLYCSPYLQAAAGSTHGCGVVVTPDPGGDARMPRNEEKTPDRLFHAQRRLRAL
ncbi:MAG TPA: hypothetical protein VJA16_03330 [Thermoanaerobaculia bacterium]